MGEDAFDPTYNVQGIDVPLTVIICPEPLVSVGHEPLTVGNIEAPVPPGLDMKPDPLLEPELLDPLELDGWPPELPELLLPLEEEDPVCAPEPPLELPEPPLDELGWEPELLPGEVTGGALASLPCEPPPLPPELELGEALPEDPLPPLPGMEPWFQVLLPPDGAWLHAAAHASAAMASPKMHSEEKRRFDFMRLPFREFTLTRTMRKGVLCVCQKNRVSLGQSFLANDILQCLKSSLRHLPIVIESRFEEKPAHVSRNGTGPSAQAEQHPAHGGRRQRGSMNGVFDHA